MRKGKVSNLVLDKQTITGTLPAEGLEGLLPMEKLEELKRAGAGTHPFVTARVDDPGLVAELEAANVKFTGRVENTWLSMLLSWILPALVFVGVWVVCHAADGRRPGRPARDRQEQGQGVRPARDRRDLRRCRRHRRGAWRADGGRRLPQESRPLPSPRREDPERGADRRRARHRQDAARQGRRGRGGGAVLQPERLGLRGDVRRGRRRAGARPLHPGPGEGPEHHLHRRAGRSGEGPRHQPDRRRPRRARADAEPAPRGAGRLRHPEGRPHPGGDQPAGDPGPRVAPARPLRPPGRARPSRPERDGRRS